MRVSDCGYIISCLLILGFIVSSQGCTWHATTAKWGSYGVNHTVQLYSGGELVREWESKGKVITETNSDGYIFKDKDTGVLVRVTGDLVITPVTD